MIAYRTAVAIFSAMDYIILSSHAVGLVSIVIDAVNTIWLNIEIVSALFLGVFGFVLLPILLSKNESQPELVKVAEIPETEPTKRKATVVKYPVSDFAVTVMSFVNSNKDVIVRRFRVYHKPTGKYPYADVYSSINPDVIDTPEWRKSVINEARQIMKEHSEAESLASSTLHCDQMMNAIGGKAHKLPPSKMFVPYGAEAITG